MTWYAIRLSIVFALVTTILVLVMAGLGQMNPRGDWIVYRVRHVEDDSTTLHIHDLERHFSMLLPGIPNTHLMNFSREGELAFVPLGEPEIWIFDVRSSVNNPKMIYTDSNVPQFYRPVWSPDGRYLAFMGGDGDPSDYLYIWDGKTVITINSPELRRQVGRIAWSQDNRLAFTARHRGQIGGRPWPAELYMWDGGHIVNLSQTPDRDEVIGTWSRNGHLAFISQELNPGDSRTVMIWDGMNSTPAFPGFITLDYIQWNAENELTVSGQQPGDTWLQIYRWDGERAINISPDSNKGYTYQTWSRDGYWAVGVIHPDQAVESMEVRDVDNQLLMDIYSPVWTEDGMLFCDMQPPRWTLLYWDWKQIRHITDGITIQALMPNGTMLGCH